MKMKLLLAGGLFLAGLITVGAFSSTTTLNPGSSTLLVSNSCRVTQVIITANANTNASTLCIDAPTNGTLYIIPGFTNFVTYGTNMLNIYTNYFGVLTTNIYTNAIVDVGQTNIQTTNSYPVRVALGAAAGSSFKADNVNYYFQSGVMVTNNSPGFAPETVTVTWFNN